MRDLKTWLEEYSLSHRHPMNKKIHNVCVPLIMFSLLGMMWVIPVPEIFERAPFLNWATLFIFSCMVFYFLLGIVTGLFMLFIAAFMLGACYAIELYLPNSLLKISALIFIVSWIGQFIGHKIEGKKPSFLEDLQFLLVGPLWVFFPWFSRFISKN